MKKSLVFVLTFLFFLFGHVVYKVSADYGDTIFYINGSDSSKLYQKPSTDTSNGSAIIPFTIGSYSVSPDGLSIVYVNPSTNYLYKKSALDTLTGSAINSVTSSSPSYSPDGLSIIYRNGSDGGKLYKKSSTDTSNGSAINSVSIESATYSPD